MSGRSVAEIIGLHLAPSRTFGDYAWYDGQGLCVGGEDWTPDVDFLLAWLLAGRCEVVDTHSFELADDRGLSHVVSCSDGDRWTEYRAPTLLAALEAAVRAVAGED